MSFSAREGSGVFSTIAEFKRKVRGDPWEFQCPRGLWGPFHGRMGYFPTVLRTERFQCPWGLWGLFYPTNWRDFYIFQTDKQFQCR
jgi:hypothetical protein